MMRDRLRKFFSAPLFEDAELNFTSQYLNLILLSLIVWAVVTILRYLALGIFFEHTFGKILISALSALVLCFIVLHARQPTFATYLTLLSLLAFPFAIMVNSGGVHNVSVLLLPVAIIVASMLLSWQNFLLYTVIIMLVLGRLAVAEVNGDLVTPFSDVTTLSNTIDAFTILSVTAFISGLLSSSLRRNKEDQKRARQLAVLNEITQQLTSTLELGTLLQHILENTVRILNCEAGSLFLLDEQTDELVFKVTVGPVAANLLGQRVPPGTGIAGRAVQMRQPLIDNDLQHSNRFSSGLDQKTGFVSRSLMAVPMQFKDRVIGVIEVINRQDGLSFVKDDESLLTAFAGQAAAALENARLYQEQIQRSRIIEALADIANEIATTREVLPVLEQITRRTVDLLGTDHVAIYLLEEDNVTLKTAAAHGTYRNELLSHTRKVGEGITGTVFLNAKAEIINNTQHDPRRVRVPGTPEEEEKIESLMSAPLILRGKTIGVINAWRLRENGVFNESELNFLVGIAHQVSICIESGRLFQETRRQAQEAAAIAEVGRDISATLELNTVLERIASSAMDLLHGETSAVYMAEANHLRPIAALGMDANEIKDYPLTIGNGILGNIALQNIGEIVNDTADDPRAIIVRDTEKKPFEHLMGVPILLKDKHTGLLAVWRLGKGTDFKQNELEFLTRLAQQAAVAIENARLYTEMQQELKERERAEEKVRELNISLEKRVEERTLQLQAEKTRIEGFAQDVQCLRELTNFLQACLTIEEAGGIISDHMSNLFPLTSGSLFLASEGSIDLVALAHWGNASTVDELDPITCWGLRQSRAYIRQGRDPSPRCSHYKDDLPEESMCLPLLVQGDVIGLICIEIAQQENNISFTPEMQNLAKASADSIALALANLRLRERLHNQSIRDPLTGIFNRRFMEETLEREVHRAGRNQEPLCVIMFEIDDFRQYNNTFGHDAGDYVLKKVTDTMKSRLRRSDFPCRYGGDEFTLLLPSTKLEDGAHRAEELRKAIEALSLSYNNQALGRVTVRMGVAAFPKHGETGEAVLKVADDASYRGRALGKNCVVVAE